MSIPKTIVLIRTTTGIMLTEIDVFDDTNTAMTYGTDYRADLYRAAYADNSGDGGTGKLSDETTPYNEDGSRLNDNVLDGPGGYIGWVNGTYNAVRLVLIESTRIPWTTNLYV